MGSSLVQRRECICAELAQVAADSRWPNPIKQVAVVLGVRGTVVTRDGEQVRRSEGGKDRGQS